MSLPMILFLLVLAGAGYGGFVWFKAKSENGTITAGERETSDAEVVRTPAQPEDSAAAGLRSDDKVFAGMAYVGPLFLFPLLLRTDSPFCQFHAIQGGVAFAAELVFVLGGILPGVGTFFSLAAIGVFFAVAIFGIATVLQGQMKELPIVGPYLRGIVGRAGGN